MWGTASACGVRGMARGLSQRPCHTERSHWPTAITQPGSVENIITPRVAKYGSRTKAADGSRCHNDSGVVRSGVSTAEDANSAPAAT